MPASTFDSILAKGIRQGQIPARTSSARLWYRGAADKVSTTPRNLMQREKDRLVNNVGIGNMYAFFYDPKTKAKLPYYDRFPLIFPIKKLPDGFLGINMHYLPYQLRARLMDALYSITNNKKYDESTKLRISYDILNSASKFKFFKPTVKSFPKDIPVNNQEIKEFKCIAKKIRASSRELNEYPRSISAIMSLFKKI